MENNRQLANKEGLKIIREFVAPIDVVFEAFSTAEAMAAWWGPAGMSIMVKEFDFRKGGRFHYKMVNDAVTMWGLFQYREISKPNLVEFVNSFSDETGNICKDPFEMNLPLEIVNSLSFTESKGITTITLNAYPVNASSDQQAAYFSIMESMYQGYNGTLDQLVAYLAQ